MSDSEGEDIFQMEEDRSQSAVNQAKDEPSSGASLPSAVGAEISRSDEAWISKFIKDFTGKNPEVSVAAAAVQILCDQIKRSKATTLMGLRVDLQAAADHLKKFSASLSLSSSCELFTRFVTRTSLDISDFEQCKARLIERGERFIQKTQESRQRIADLGHPFIRDGATVLTHGFSRCVCTVLATAAAQNKRFNVYVTESRPDAAGIAMARRLESYGVPVTRIINDAAVAHIMDQVDLVLVGAEAVVENGGIINKIGTYQISIVAKAFNRPFYVTAESFKFTRLYPLTQRDIPDTRVASASPSSPAPPANCTSYASLPINLQTPSLYSNTGPASPHPIKSFRASTGIVSSRSEGDTGGWQASLQPQNQQYLDYTPPSYLTLLFTDLGVLTPSAVSDELIKLYY